MIAKLSGGKRERFKRKEKRWVFAGEGNRPIRIGCPGPIKGGDLGVEPDWLSSEWAICCSVSTLQLRGTAFGANAWNSAGRIIAKRDSSFVRNR